MRHNASLKWSISHRSGDYRRSGRYISIQEETLSDEI